MKKNRIITIVKWIWLVVVLAAAVYYVATNFETSVNYLKTVRIFGVVLSILFVIISRLLMVDLIRESVIEVGWTPTFKEMFSLVSITQLGKYIPGGVWQFAARFGAYKENKLTVKTMGKAFLIENVWVITGGVLSGIILLLLGNSQRLLDQIGIRLSTTLSVLFILLSLGAWLIGLFIFQRILHKTSPGRMAFLRSLRLILSHGLMYFFMGLSLYFLFPTWNEKVVLYTTGAYAFSYLAGYLAIFAPGGIGVREVATVFLFSGFAPQAELASLTIVHRLIFTIIEFLMGLLGFIYTRRKNGIISSSPSIKDSRLTAEPSSSNTGENHVIDLESELTFPNQEDQG